MSCSRCCRRGRGSGVVVGRDFWDGVFTLLLLFVCLVVLCCVYRLGLFTSLLEPIHDAVFGQVGG